MKRVGLSIVGLLGFVMIGYGVLPFLATDMDPQIHIVGGALGLAGLACVLFALVNWHT